MVTLLPIVETMNFFFSLKRCPECLLALSKYKQREISMGSRSNFQVFLCLSMGWVALIGIKQLVNTIDMNGIILMFIGGVFFTVGVFFLLWKNFRYSHAIWHLLVLGGCICHYFTIIYYIIPYKKIIN